MLTTVRIPRPLLDRADARAKALGISRNRLIADALEARLQARDEWPAELVQLLTHPAGPGVAKAADDLNQALRKHRHNRRKPPAL